MQAFLIVHLLITLLAGPVATDPTGLHHLSISTPAAATPLHPSAAVPVIKIGGSSLEEQIGSPQPPADAASLL